MLKLFSKFGFCETGPIGFDLAWENLNLIQLKHSTQGPALQNCLVQPYHVSKEKLLADPQLFKSFVKDALKKGRMHGKTVVTALPASEVQIIPINYDASPDQDEEAIIVKGAMQRIGGDAADFVFDYIPIRSLEKGSRNKNAMVVAAHHQTITTYLDQLSEAGLKVAALDIGPAILRRLVASLDREGSYPSVLLINFGRINCYVTFIAGRRLMLDRELEFGESQFCQTLAQALDTNIAHSLELLQHYGLGNPEKNRSAGEKLVEFETKQTITKILKPTLLDFAEEINKLLVYAASETRGKSVNTVYILGSAARYPGFGELLQGILALPTKVLDPLAHLTDANKPATILSPESASGTAIAVGLALREI